MTKHSKAARITSGQEPDWTIVVTPSKAAGDGEVRLTRDSSGIVRATVQTQAHRRITIYGPTPTGLLTGLGECEILLRQLPQEIIDQARVSVPLPSGNEWTGSIPELLKMTADTIRRTKVMAELARSIATARDVQEKAKLPHERQQLEKYITSQSEKLAALKPKTTSLS